MINSQNFLFICCCLIQNWLLYVIYWNKNKFDKLETRFGLFGLLSIDGIDPLIKVLLIDKVS